MMAVTPRVNQCEAREAPNGMMVVTPRVNQCEAREAPSGMMAVSGQKLTGSLQYDWCINYMLEQTIFLTCTVVTALVSSPGTLCA